MVCLQVAEGCVLGYKGDIPVDPLSCATCRPSKAVPYLQSITETTRCSKCPQGTFKELLSRRGEDRNLLNKLWYCVPGMDKRYTGFIVQRGTNGDPVCASVDGQRCLRGLPGSDAGCSEMMQTMNAPGFNATKVFGAELRPLSCGEQHNKVWKYNAYTASGRHWCVVARDWFQDNQLGEDDSTRQQIDSIEAECTKVQVRRRFSNVCVSSNAAG